MGLSDTQLENWARAAQSVALWRKLDAHTGCCVLLKGPVWQQLLYEPDELRRYGDTDLLVPPRTVARASEALRGMGFEPHYLIEDALGLRDDHASTWKHSRDGSWIDLHLKLPGVPETAESAWWTLESHLTTLKIIGSEVRTLDRVASAVLVTLHAASHGPEHPRTRDEVGRAIARWSGIWQDAATLAESLGAIDAFSLGLRCHPAGATVADSLGLEWRPTTRQRLQWSTSAWAPHVIEELSASDWRGRVRVVARTLFPPPRSVKLGTPWARRGSLTLLLAYVVRPFRLAVRLPGAVRTWHQARRS